MGDWLAEWNFFKSLWSDLLRYNKFNIHNFITENVVYKHLCFNFSDVKKKHTPV